MTGVDVVEAATELRLRSRAEQGLPPTVEDAGLLDEVEALRYDAARAVWLRERSVSS